MSKNAHGEDNKRYPAYEDTNLMQFGEHKDKPLSDVPASYLEWLWNRGEPPLRSGTAGGFASRPKTMLANYIWNSRHALNQELKEELIT